MRGQFKALIITGAMLTAGLAGAAPAAAATAAPTLVTSNFACSNGVCEVGPGNVGLPFAAALTGTGGPTYTGPECNGYTMKVINGSLPPGLQLGEPICEWTIAGTPTKAGTYAFTAQITPQPNNLGQIPGPSGTQQLTITIGTGSSDRLALTRATWSPNSVNKFLQVAGFDANAGATFTVFLTSSGKQIGTATESTSFNDGSFVTNIRVLPSALSETNPGTVTVKSSLGASATFPISVNLKYS
jgi:hypothetical protein